MAGLNCRASCATSTGMLFCAPGLLDLLEVACSLSAAEICALEVRERTTCVTARFQIFSYKQTARKQIKIMGTLTIMSILPL